MREHCRNKGSQPDRIRFLNVKRWGSNLIHGIVHLVVVLTSVSTLYAQQTNFTQITRPVATITNPDLIDYLLFQLIIEPVSTPRGIRIVDVTQNGYGPDDVLVVLPSMETFLLPEILPDSVQSIMRGWIPDQEFRFDSGNPDVLSLSERLDGADAGVHTAERALMVEMLSSISRRYAENRMSVFLERTDEGFSYQMWGYDKNAFNTVVANTQGAADNNEHTAAITPREPEDDVRSSPASKALSGLARVPGVRRRELAARTILLGTHDLDGSGMIDTAAELNGVPCSVWVSFEDAFPNFAQTFGFVDDEVVHEQAYLGSLAFNISERVKAGTARVIRACLSGTDPPRLLLSDIAPPPVRSAMPDRLVALLESEAAASVIMGAWTLESGSAAWAAVVRHTLLQVYDGDGSGLIDTEVEVDAISCLTWQAITATYSGFLSGLGFEGPRIYAGYRIGLDGELRHQARNNAVGCRDESASTTYFRPESALLTEELSAPNGSRVDAARNALEGLASVTDRARRELAAKTILLGTFDVDGSGYVDHPVELDAISCSVWSALQSAFPQLAEEYGLIDDAEILASRYHGSLVFNLSERIKRPAARRIGACLAGDFPPTTTRQDVTVRGRGVQMTATLAAILEANVAAQLLRRTSRLEPGSAAWAEETRHILVAEYDVDQTGLIDTPLELGLVPCLAWQAVLATYPGVTTGLGFDGTREYAGIRIGIDVTLRNSAAAQMQTCRER